MMADLRSRIFKVALSAILTIGLVPSWAFANPDEPTYLSESKAYIEVANTLTGEAVVQSVDDSEAALPSSAEDDYLEAVAATVSYAEAVEAIKNAMSSRQPSVSVVVNVDVSEQDGIAEAMFYASLEEDGDPTHGDYLRFIYETMSCSAVMWSDGTTLCNYEIFYKTTAEQEAELESQVELVLDELNLVGRTDYEKTLAIYDFICEHVEYDYENLENDAHRLKYTAYAALMDGTSVCQGYASLFYFMAGKAGLSTRIISGTGNGDLHSWNIVQLDDGRYYNIDATWDSARYQAGQDYEYFLKSEADFANHVRGTSSESGSIDYGSEDFMAAYPMAEVSYSEQAEDSSDWNEFGTCEWLIDESGCLTIRPANGAESGVLESVRYANHFPWYAHRETVTKVVFEEGVCAGEEIVGLFYECENLVSVDFSDFDTSACTNMKGVFYGCYALESLDLSGFDTSKVTDMSAMFMACRALTTLDLSSFDTSNVTNMELMFSNCYALESIGLSGFDTSKVADMSSMFFTCYALESLDLSGFDTSKVADMGGMFGHCQALKTLDVSGFDTSKVTEMSSMFFWCTNLDTLDLSEFDTSQVEDMHYMFYQCKSLVSLDISGFDTSNVGNMLCMFAGCSALSSLDVSGFDTSNVTNMYQMFYVCRSLDSLDVSGFDTSNVTNMNAMFQGCEKVVKLDVSGFETSKLTSLCYLFYGCESLESLDLSGFDTSNVTDMSGLFRECKSLEFLNVSGFDTSNVTDMSEMFGSSFGGCGSLVYLDVSSFDTSNVKDMSGMFASCRSLESLDISGFDTSNVEDMSRMFQSCVSLKTLDVSSFDTAKVSNMASMFESCVSLKSLDLSAFNTSNVEDMNQMFRNCKALTSIDISDFDASRTTSTDGLFYDCVGLESVALPETMDVIGDNAFYGCTALNRVVIPASVSAFGSNAFCKLASPSMVIASTVDQYDTISKNANYVTVSRTTVVLLGADEAEGILYTVSDSKATVVGYLGEGAELKIPSSIDDFVVVAIEKSLLCDYAKLESVVVSEGITSIGANAFSGCSSLVSLRLPSSIASIGSNALPANHLLVVECFEGSYAADYAQENDISTRYLKDVEKVSFNIEDCAYTGDLQKPSIVAQVGGEVLAEGIDYSVECEAQKNAGKYAISIVGYGDYEGELELVWSIEPAVLTATYAGEDVEAGSAPGLAVSVIGFVNGEDAESASGYVAPAVSAPEALVPGGSYLLTPWGGSADNYTFTYVGGTLSVKAQAAEVPVAASGLVYSGKEQVGVAEGKGYDLSGVSAAASAGAYEAIATLREGYVWSDGATGPKAIGWSIEPAVLTATFVGETIDEGEIPQLAVTVTGFVNGETVESAAGYEMPFVLAPETLVLGGSYSLMPSGGYADNYTFEYVGGTLSVRAQVVEVPVAASGLVYNGDEQVGVSESEYYELSGQFKAVEAGSYEAVASLREGCVWSDGTTAPKTIRWSIAKAVYDMSGVSFEDKAVTYDGGWHSVKISGELPPGITGVNYNFGSAKYVGSYTVRAWFFGDFDNYELPSQMIATLTIEPADISLVEGLEISSQECTGLAVEPTLELVYKGMKLEEGFDYELTYENNVEVGTAVAVVRGLDNYTGTKEIPFEIVMPEEASVSRIWGDYARDTAAAISEKAFSSSEGCEWVVIARDDDFRDAMSATGLAGALNAPILLTSRYGLSEVAAEEIQRLGATRAYIIGGKGAMPGDLESELAAIGCAAEPRVYGDASYDTSVKCAELIADLNEADGVEAAPVIVAYGQNFQDALSMSSFAYSQRAPIFLQTFGDTAAKRGLTQEAVSLINSEFADSKFFVAGGAGAVSNASVAAIGFSEASGDVRLWGNDGYETSLVIAEHMVENGYLDPGVVVVASGAQAPKGLDALAGAALAGKHRGVMLLANGQPSFGSVNTSALDAFLGEYGDEMRGAYVLGGSYVMPEATIMDRIKEVLGVSFVD